MYYSALIYGVDGVFEKLPEDRQNAILEAHYEMQRVTQAEGKLGEVARLMGTSSAVTIRKKGDTIMVLDGPFAETKEQLLGFYMIEADTIEEATEIAKRLPLDAACVEVRAVAWLRGSAENG